MGSYPEIGYRRLYDCAAYGCERTRDDGYLGRISPKGKGSMFVGLCQDHYGRSVYLKPAASAILDLSRGVYRVEP